ncbi:acyl carrier protein [Geomonas silvestris]|uniref:Acyl carrier protein n=1 Tax=Geomonas silvestris TaxID=2740184 RepID=A0A6V8ML02_9BACT|nr:acyl carrier protein [Geomonas silvestris]GFO60319.1 acyl carrier protein [Geomonas silvestris]
MQAFPSLTAIFREVFCDDTLELNPAMTAKDIEGWDSFAHMNLVTLIEVRYNIAISDTEVLTLKNVGDIATLVSGKLKAEVEV